MLFDHVPHLNGHEGPMRILVGRESLTRCPIASGQDKVRQRVRIGRGHHERDGRQEEQRQAAGS
jgi:hypothetical protein